MRNLAIAALLALIPTSGAAQDDLAAALRRLEADDVLVADRAVEEIVAFGEPARDPLLRLLRDDRRDVRAGAIRGLGLLGETRAAAPLRDLLRASLDRTEPDTMEDRYFRILAIQALGRIPDSGAQNLLREVAEREDAFERAHAGISLFLLGEDPGYDLVRGCLADTTMALRKLAVEGLAGADSEGARDLVLPMASDDSWVVREAALRAIASWSLDDEARTILDQGSRDPSWFVRQTASELRAIAGNH